MRAGVTVCGRVLMAGAVLVGVLPGCAPRSTQQNPVERGKYLVMVGGCNDCHTPKIMTPAGPVPDTTRLLAGYTAGSRLPEIPKGIFEPGKWLGLTNGDMTAWAGPWGVSFASNLTPDLQTGTGGWPEEMFIKTLRGGKFMGMSRDILPPMPWQTIGQMTDEDLKAVFTYLKSITPIHNAVPAPLPPTQ